MITMNHQISASLLLEIMELNRRYPNIWMAIKDVTDLNMTLDFGHILSNGEHERAIQTIHFELNNGRVRTTRFTHS